MQEGTYSASIADVIKDFLNETHCSFIYDDRRDQFRFGVRLSGMIKAIEYTIDIRESEYILYAVFPVNVNENDGKMMAAMAEFLCRVNYDLINGRFELNMKNGEIRIKCYVDCGEIAPTTEMVMNSICFPGVMYDRYGQGILDIIFDNAAPKEAIDRCERLAAAEHHTSLGEWVSEDTEVPKHIKIDLFGTEGGID